MELPAGQRSGDALALRGRTAPWGPLYAVLLAVCAAAAFFWRADRIDAEGLADDEVHKVRAAERYLRGDFGGDDLEHPMLLKALIAGSMAAFPRAPPEFHARLPNAIAAALSVIALALLGRRLFGRSAGLLAAALAASSVTLAGYQRVAKEDTLLALFLLLLLWCLAEARAAAEDGRGREQARWEMGTGAALGAMLASKYFVFFALIPLAAYLWLLPASRWRMKLSRWAALAGVALLVFLALNWKVLTPEAWRYIRSYMAGERTMTATMSYAGRIFDNVPAALRTGLPPSFYFVFIALKLTPLVLIAAGAGLLAALALRAPAHRVVLAWLGVWFATFLLSGSKYGRFAVSMLPALLLLAAHAAVALGERLAGLMRSYSILPSITKYAAAALGVGLIAGEAAAQERFAPHQRLYLSALAGNEHGPEWFFPHCDYFDAGLREAVRMVAAHAEPGAELATDVDWPVGFYAERAGRSDLRVTLLREGVACRAGRVCYVFTQVGRRYRHNERALEALARRAPWHIEWIADRPAVTVYRLEPGEPAFPAGALSGARSSLPY